MIDNNIKWSISLFIIWIINIVSIHIDMATIFSRAVIFCSAGALVMNMLIYMKKLRKLKGKKHEQDI